MNKMQGSARYLPRISWSTIASTHLLHIHAPIDANEIPDRKDPKQGRGGDPALARARRRGRRVRREARFGRWDLKETRALLAASCCDLGGIRLEELPSAKTPVMHEVIVKDLSTFSKLIDASKEKGTPTPGLDL